MEKFPVCLKINLRIGSRFQSQYNLEANAKISIHGRSIIICAFKDGLQSILARTLNPTPPGQPAISGAPPSPPWHRLFTICQGRFSDSLVTLPHPHSGRTQSYSSNHDHNLHSFLHSFSGDLPVSRILKRGDSEPAAHGHKQTGDRWCLLSTSPVLAQVCFGEVTKIR